MISTWPRLRVFAVSQQTDAQRIGFLIKCLEDKDTIQANELRDAAYYLRRLLMKPKILDALMSPRPGRKADDESINVAIARYVRGLQLGKGKAKIAQDNVAKVCSQTEKQVARAFTKYKVNAAYLVSEQLKKVGRKSVGRKQGDGTTAWEYWTKDEILNAMWLDLQDHFTKKGQKSRKR